MLRARLECERQANKKFIDKIKEIKRNNRQMMNEINLVLKKLEEMKK